MFQHNFDLLAANFITKCLVDFGTLLSKFRAQKAINEDVCGRIDNQKNVAYTDHDERPKIKKFKKSYILALNFNK